MTLRTLSSLSTLQEQMIIAPILLAAGNIRGMAQTGLDQDQTAKQPPPSRDRLADRSLLLRSLRFGLLRQE
jgi:hypothetical protein